MLPDDVQALIQPVLGHRLVLASYTSLRGKSVPELLAEVRAQVPVPVEEHWSEGRVAALAGTVAQTPAQPSQAG